MSLCCVTANGRCTTLVNLLVSEESTNASIWGFVPRHSRSRGVLKPIHAALLQKVNVSSRLKGCLDVDTWLVSFRDKFSYESGSQLPNGSYWFYDTL
jgi:hypothetical protein